MMGFLCFAMKYTEVVKIPGYNTIKRAILQMCLNINLMNASDHSRRLVCTEKSKV